MSGCRLLPYGLWVCGVVWCGVVWCGVVWWCPEIMEGAEVEMDWLWAKEGELSL